MPLQVSHDETAGVYTGRPWLVLAHEDEPAVAAFKTDGEAFDYVSAMEDAYDDYIRCRAHGCTALAHGTDGYCDDCREEIACRAKDEWDDDTDRRMQAQG